MSSSTFSPSDVSHDVLTDEFGLAVVGALLEHRPFAPRQRRHATPATSIVLVRQIAEAFLLEFSTENDHQTMLKRGKMCIIKYTLVPAALLTLSGVVQTAVAFSPQGQPQVRTSTAIQAADQNEDVVLYSDEWEDGVPPPPSAAKNKNRWNALSPSVKAKIVKEAQQRAIQNKKKNESSSDKKRRKSLFPTLHPISHSYERHGWNI